MTVFRDLIGIRFLPVGPALVVLVPLDILDMIRGICRNDRIGAERLADDRRLDAFDLKAVVVIDDAHGHGNGLARRAGDRDLGLAEAAAEDDPARFIQRRDLLIGGGVIMEIIADRSAHRQCIVLPDAVRILALQNIGEFIFLNLISRQCNIGRLNLIVEMGIRSREHSALAGLNARKGSAILC